MATIKTPERDTQFQVGPDAFIFVAFEPEEDADQQGRTVIIGHDDNGDEVEIHFHPRTPEQGWYEDEDEPMEFDQ